MANSVNWPWATLNSDSAGSASSVFKAVSAKNSAKPAMTALAQTSAPSAPQDTVNVSKLGKALTGMAAKAYEHLDKDAKTLLNNLVESGKVSAEDAVKGLRSMAKNALFGRFQQEAGSTTEEREAERKMEALSARLFEQNGQKQANDMSARTDVSNLYGRYTSGEISEEAYRSQIDDLSKKLRGSSNTVDRSKAAEFREEDSKLLNFIIGSKAKRFAALDFGEEDNETEDSEYKVVSKDESQAAERLGKAGFVVYSNAMQRFAADYDMPGFGKGVMPDWRINKPISG